MAVRASAAASRAVSSLLSQVSWMARVRLLVTVRRGVGWDGGGDSGGGDSGGGDGGSGCDSGGGGGGGVGGGGVEALLRPCGRAPKGTGVIGVAAAASAGVMPAVACSGGVGLGTLRRFGGVNVGGGNGRGGIVSGGGRVATAASHSSNLCENSR